MSVFYIPAASSTSADITLLTAAVNDLEVANLANTAKLAAATPLSTASTLVERDALGSATFTSASSSAAPLTPTDLTNKAYVDAFAAGFSWREAADMKITAPLPSYVKSGTNPNVTYTASVNGALSVDGIAVVLGDRILLDQTLTAPQDAGIFVVSATGSAGTKWALTRASDTLTLFQGAGVCVISGTLNASTQYVLTTQNPIVVGTTTQTWQIFSAGNVTMSGEVTGSSAASVVTATSANTNNSIVRRGPAGQSTHGELTSTSLLVSPSGQINFGNPGVSARKLILYDVSPGTAYQFSGLGIEANAFLVSLSGTTVNMPIYAATGASTRNKVFEILGTGGATTTGTITAGNLATPAGGQVNLGGVALGRKIALMDLAPGTPTSLNYIGMAVDAGRLVLHTQSSSTDHAFTAASVDLLSKADLFVVKGTGGVQFPNATASYTPSTLNYYEEYSYTSTFNNSGGAVVTGAIPIKIVRVGKKVTMDVQGFDDVTATGTYLGSVTNFPARFYPQSSTGTNAIIIGELDNVYGVIQALVQSGSISIRAATSAGSFTQIGFQPFSMSWICG